MVLKVRLPQAQGLCLLSAANRWVSTPEASLAGVRQAPPLPIAISVRCAGTARTSFRSCPASLAHVVNAAAYLPGAELTLDEAKAAAELRRAHLQGLLDARTGEVDRIRAHLRLVEQSLSDLAGLTASSTA